MKKVSRKTYREIFRGYLNDGFRLERWQWVGMLLAAMVFAGFFGWVYEFVFYFFDGGMTEWYMQGGNLLPWINIYAIGALLIIAATWRVRKYPWAVFLIAVVATGLLELVAGWLVYTIGNGTRYWDYNTEILNFGNIGGFVCLRSVLVFGVSALMLMYLIVPGLIYLMRRVPRRVFMTVVILLFAAVMVDEVVNLVLKNLGQPTAMDYYKSLGWKYR